LRIRSEAPPRATRPPWAIGKGIYRMQIVSSRTIRPAPLRDGSIPYSAEAMRQDLQRVRNTWEECQGTRNRDAIYGYLAAVYDLVAWWTAEGRETDRAVRALCSQRLRTFDREDPFASIIRCTADPAKADKRTRSKWSRVMRYAADCKDLAEPLDLFIRRRGGLNKCAARFSLRLRRLSEIESKIRATGNHRRRGPQTGSPARSVRHRA
jgi:hypothetical protein